MENVVIRSMREEDSSEVLEILRVLRVILELLRRCLKDGIIKICDIQLE